MPITNPTSGIPIASPLVVALLSEVDDFAEYGLDEDVPFASSSSRTSWSRPWLNALPVELRTKGLIVQQLLSGL
jgi:hypothetical protein